MAAGNSARGFWQTFEIPFRYFSGFSYGYCALTGAELYDPATQTFSPTGDMTVDRALHTATLLGNGKVLIAGGQESESTTPTYVFLASAELYDPVTGTFTVTDSMATPRVGHTATLLGSGKVLMIGGRLTSAELYQWRGEPVARKGGKHVDADGCE